MCALIQANLDLCRIEADESEVVQSDANDYLRRASAPTRKAAASCEIAFFDPPYATDYHGVLKALGAENRSVLAQNGLLIVEHHHKTDLPELVGTLKRYRVLKQGESALSFFEGTTRST